MKHLYLILTLLIGCVAQANTLSDSTNRVVMKAAQDFEHLEVYGDIVVECRFNPKYAGYIVYHHNDNTSPQLIKCTNDSTTLTISGNRTLNDIKSRIVVFCTGPIKSLTANDSAKIVAYKLPRIPYLRMELNNNSSIKLGDIETRRLDIVTNDNSNLKLDNTRAGELYLLGNNNSITNIEVLRTRIANIEANDNHNLTISNIKAKEFYATGNNNSTIKLSGKALKGAINKNDNTSIVSDFEISENPSYEE